MTLLPLPIPITNVSTLKPFVMLNDMIILIICIMIEWSLLALWQVELYSGEGAHVMKATSHF